MGQARAGAFDGYSERQVARGEALPLPRRQNPHMHLLEAFLALYEASGEAHWLARAQSIHDLFRRHFLQQGQLVEFFDADWREVPQDGRDGARRLREPGHFFEWAWLLHRLALLTGDAGAAAAMRPLYDRAWEKGVDRGREAPCGAFEEQSGRAEGGERVGQYE